MPAEEAPPLPDEELLESGDDDGSSSSPPDSNSSSRAKHLLDLLSYVAIAALAPVAARILSILLRMLGIWWREPPYYIEHALMPFITSQSIQLGIFSLVLAFVFISLRWINCKEQTFGFPPLAILVGLLTYPLGLFFGILSGALLLGDSGIWIWIVYLHICGALAAGVAAKFAMLPRFKTPPRYKREWFVWGISLLGFLATIAMNPTSNFPKHGDDKTRLTWAKEHMGGLFPVLEEQLLASPSVARLAGDQARVDVSRDGRMTLSPGGSWERLEGTVTVVGARGKLRCDFYLTSEHEEKEFGDDHIKCSSRTLLLELDPETGNLLDGYSNYYDDDERMWQMRLLEPELEHIRKTLGALPWVAKEAGAFDAQEIALPRGHTYHRDHVKPFRDLLAVTVIVPGASKELTCRVGLHWDDLTGKRDIVECWSGATGRMIYHTEEDRLFDKSNAPIQNPTQEDAAPLQVAPGAKEASL